MPEKSFSEILYSQISARNSAKNFKNPSENQKSTPGFETMDPAHLAYLIGNIQLKIQSPVDKKSAYFQKNRTQKTFESQRLPPGDSLDKAPTSAPKAIPHALSPEQQKAFDFFVIWKRPLPVNFSASELRSGFRQLALKIHPDTQDQDLKNKSPGELTQAFMDLRRNYQILKAVFEK